MHCFLIYNIKKYLVFFTSSYTPVFYIHAHTNYLVKIWKCLLEPSSRMCVVFFKFPTLVYSL